MSQAFGAVKSARTTKIEGYDGSIGRAIRHRGVAPRRIAAPPIAGAQREDCRYSCGLLSIAARGAMRAWAGSAPARARKRRRGQPDKDLTPSAKSCFVAPLPRTRPKRLS